MCGILLYHGAGKEFCDELYEFGENYKGNMCRSSCTSSVFNSLVPYVASRGPNYSSLRLLHKHSMCWFSSVLSIRQPFTKQSVPIGNRYILQFNGELYNEDIIQNDTAFFASLLKTDAVDITDKICSLEGEFAYTIYDMFTANIYFGRDDVGKRSLSYFLPPGTGEIYISSISGRHRGFNDCAAGVIYIYSIQQKKLTQYIQPAMKKKVSSEINTNKTEIESITNMLYEQLASSVAKRVNSIHPIHLQNSPIGVLFSGGLDCSVITALICQQLNSKPSKPVVELLNVSFENPRTGMKPSATPDRKLAVRSAGILRNLYPDIDIRLVEVDVSYDEYLNKRPVIIDLMFPKNTEMDLSIAIAFYFASKGNGHIELANGQRLEYQRQGVVLFSGLGADELYGGYHKFLNKSPAELAVELTKQINNIHDRNLNRDDKVTACNGVEMRYPFLDRKVIDFSLSQIPINLKVNKLILRKLAMTILALGDISEEPKRAIQFGSKSAKMTKDGNKHGTDLLE